MLMLRLVATALTRRPVSSTSSPVQAARHRIAAALAADRPASISPADLLLFFAAVPPAPSAASPAELAFTLPADSPPASWSTVARGWATATSAAAACASSSTCGASTSSLSAAVLLRALAEAVDACLAVVPGGDDAGDSPDCLVAAVLVAVQVAVRPVELRSVRALPPLSVPYLTRRVAAEIPGLSLGELRAAAFLAVLARQRMSSPLVHAVVDALIQHLPPVGEALPASPREQLTLLWDIAMLLAVLAPNTASHLQFTVSKAQSALTDYVATGELVRTAAVSDLWSLVDPWMSAEPSLSPLGAAVVTELSARVSELAACKPAAVPKLLLAVQRYATPSVQPQILGTLLAWIEQADFVKRATLEECALLAECLAPLFERAHHRPSQLAVLASRTADAALASISRTDHAAGLPPSLVTFVVDHANFVAESASGSTVVTLLAQSIETGSVPWVDLERIVRAFSAHTTMLQTLWPAMRKRLVHDAAEASPEALILLLHRLRSVGLVLSNYPAVSAALEHSVRSFPWAQQTHMRGCTAGSMHSTGDVDFLTTVLALTTEYDMSGAVSGVDDFSNCLVMRVRRAGPGPGHGPSGERSIDLWSLLDVRGAPLPAVLWSRLVDVLSGRVASANFLQLLSMAAAAVGAGDAGSNFNLSLQQQLAAHGLASAAFAASSRHLLNSDDVRRLADADRREPPAVSSGQYMLLLRLARASRSLDDQFSFWLAQQATRLQHAFGFAETQALVRVFGEHRVRDLDWGEELRKWVQRHASSLPASLCHDILHYLSSARVRDPVLRHALQERLSHQPQPSTIPAR
jgi:hypothetical protein